jgi:hypothetical protein
LSRKFALGLAAVVVIAAGFAWYASHQQMDFRVYYYGTRGVFDGERPVYGDKSGMGWPMHYRYPPLFLFLSWPFTLLSLPAAAAIFVILKCAALFVLVARLWSRLGAARTNAAWLVPLLLAGPYVVEDLRYGNAQSLIFVLTGLALLAVSTVPLLAAAALALAISIKVWPFFFVPLLAARREWKVVAWTVVFTALLLMLPAFYFGFQGNLDLLSQWTHQEFSTQTGPAEIWFPSQSLRGVMIRYLTVIDYSRVPDSNYPLVHVAAMDAAGIRSWWLVLDGLGYLALLAITMRHKTAMFGLMEGLAFTALVLLQPFSQKYTLVVLLWPAIIAGRLVEKSRARGFLYAAMALTLAQPIINGSAAQRLLQVLGFDFLATALLAAFLIASTYSRATERYSAG